MAFFFKIIIFISPGGGWGDPHITTLDKTTYTFNGLGEYILLDIADPPFQLQFRTARALNKDNVPTDATIYSAFAVRERPDDGTLLQVELNNAKDGMSSKCWIPDIFPYTINDLC